MAVGRGLQNEAVMKQSSKRMNSTEEEKSLVVGRGNLVEGVS